MADTTIPPNVTDLAQRRHDQLVSPVRAAAEAQGFRIISEVYDHRDRVALLLAPSDVECKSDEKAEDEIGDFLCRAMMSATPDDEEDPPFLIELDDDTVRELKEQGYRFRTRKDGTTKIIPPKGDKK